MLSNPLGKSPLGFLPLDHISSELTDSLPTPTLRNARLESSRSLLYSRSSSPSDSDTSGFSSGSDHLSELIVSVLGMLKDLTLRLCDSSLSFERKAVNKLVLECCQIIRIVHCKHEIGGRLRLGVTVKELEKDCKE